MYLNIFFKKLKKYIRNICQESPYNIISLGPNCYPKTILTRKGLIKRHNEGEMTLPFDLAWYHSAKYITEFLNNNFENFLTDLKYSEYSNSWDNGEKINFSHEAYIGPTEKHRLIQVYRNRIKNFRKKISEKKPILFLQIFKDEKIDSDCTQTYEAIKNLCLNKKFIYVVIDCTNSINKKSLPQEIIFLEKPFPIEHPDVFDKSFYMSEPGAAFEQEIADFLENIIKEEFAIWPVNYL